MSNAKDLRSSSVEDLQSKLTELKKERLKIRVQVTTGTIEKPALKKQNQKEIARILTILREKGVRI